MCMSSPKITEPPPTPAPPPPPTKTADRVKDKKLGSQAKSKRRGTSALTIRRPSVNTGTSGTGANLNY